MLVYLSYAADLLMIAASTGAAIYCLVLSRRLSRLTSFDTGIGGAIAVLSAQVDEMKQALSEAKTGSDGAGRHLQDLVHQAREISGELELMIASCHDFAEEAMVVQGAVPGAVPSGNGAGAAPVQVGDMGDDPADPAGAEAMFGSRRATGPTAVFRRHAPG
jgi:hypothetical protein